MSTVPVLEFSDRPQSKFPGIAKTAIRPKRKKKSPSVGGSCSSGSGRSGQSSRSANASGIEFSVSDKKCATAKDAIAWGRVAAVLGWGLGDLAAEVEVEFHPVATEAYERRMIQLHGAPF